MRRFLVAILITLLPGFSHAAVLINEVAWMGNENSANDEWIELYNTGSAVDLAGWVLTDNTSLDVMLEGTIADGDRVVLERTDDTSAPGIAFMVYTGALSNEGRTLTLLRPDGSIEDQVAGGENWEDIGGDNETKDTAQRTDGGWITAAPTPGAVNATTPSVSDDTDDDEDERSTAEHDDEEVVHISLSEPDNELLLSIDGPSRAYVNQEVTFSAEGSGIGETLLESLKYFWNYGDAYTGHGNETTHTYTHPGSYVVVARAAFNKYEAVARHDVTVLPVTFSLGRAENGDVLVHNDAKYEVRLGGYTLRGDTEFVLPEDTILVPNATVRIPRGRVENGASKMLVLYDGEGELVASHVPGRLARTTTVPEQNEEARASVQTRTQRTAAPSNTHTETVSENAPDPQPERIVVAPEASTTPGGALSAAVAASGNERLPYLALVGIMLVGILAVYSRRVV